MKPALKKAITYFLISVVVVLCVSALLFDLALYRDHIFLQHGIPVTIIVAIVNVGISVTLGFLISKKLSYNKLSRFSSLLSISVFFENSLLNAFLEAFLKTPRDSNQYFEISQHIVLALLAILICEIMNVTLKTQEKKDRKQYKTTE